MNNTACTGFVTKNGTRLIHLFRLRLKSLENRQQKKAILWAVGKVYGLDGKNTVPKLNINGLLTKIIGLTAKTIDISQ